MIFSFPFAGVRGFMLPCLLGLVGFLPSALALPASLGDLDEDGEHTVLDLARLAAHLEGTQPLSPAFSLYADVTQDGVLNGDDQQALLRLVVQSDAPESLPAATVRFTSPANGEGDVALTRETVVHFTVPLAPAAALDSTRLRSEFGGRKVLSRVELSSDRKKATLFYLEPLPSNARIQVTLDGAGLTDLLGRPVDLDDDGLAAPPNPPAAPPAGSDVEGDIYQASFDTLSITPVAATAIRGRVFASKPAAAANGQPIDTPLVGVTITVDGAEETLRTTTDAAGNFTLSPCPAGSFFIHIDGRTSPASAWPNGDYYPFVGKRWEAVAGRNDNLSGNPEDTARGTIYLPCVCAGTLKPVSQTQDTKITFPASVLAEYPALAGTELTVPANSLFADDGTRGGKVGMAPVAPTRLPSPLPRGLNLPMVITVQSDGATNFDRPVPVCLPNLPDPVTGQKLPPGAKSALWSFTHDLGNWEVVGPMTVTEDGLFVKTDAGVGVRQPGWHGAQPGSQIHGGENVAQNPSKLCWQPARAVWEGLWAAGDCFSGFINGKSWIKCGFSTMKAVKETVSYFRSARGPAQSANRALLESISSSIGVSSAGWTALKDCGLAGVGTASPLNKVKAAFSCAGSAAGAVAGYCDNLPAECRTTTICRAGEAGNAILGLGLAGQGFAGALDKLDSTDPQSIVDAVSDGLSAAKAQVDNILAALDAQYPGNPNPPISTQTIENLNGVLAPVEASLNNALAMEGPLTRTGETISSFEKETAAGQAAASEAVRENGQSTAGRDWVLVTTTDADGLNPQILRQRSGPGGGFTITVRPGGNYVVEKLNPDTGAVSTLRGNTGAAGQQVLLPAIPAAPAVPLPDGDADGLSDRGETIMGTNPQSPDTDGDGITDGVEVSQGTNPVDGLIVSTGVIASAPVTGHAVDVCAVNNIAITANGANGISVFNILSGLNPVRLAEVDTPGIALSVACSGDLVAVADHAGGLIIVDISDARSARIVRIVDVGSPTLCVVTSGSVAYVGTESGRIVVVDILSGVLLQTRALTTGSLEDIGLDGDHLIALTSTTLHRFKYGSGQLIDAGQVAVSGSPSPFELGRKLFVGGSLGYVGTFTGFKTFDLAAQPRPTLIGQSLTTQAAIHDFAANGSGLLVASTSFAGTQTLAVSLYDATVPADVTRFLTSFDTPGDCRGLSLYNGLAYVADSDRGLQVINYRAYDTQGQPPTIVLSSNFNLAGGAAEEGALMRLTASVTDDVQVRNVEFYVDGALILTDGNFPFEHRLVTPVISPHKSAFTVRARATDTGGNATWSPEFAIALVPDATPPQVLTTQPAHGSLIGATSQAIIAFNEFMTPASLQPAITVAAAGADRALGTADDIAVPGSVSWQEVTRSALVIFASPFSQGLYRLAVSPPAADAAGNPLAAPVMADFLVYSADLDTDADGVPDEVERALGLNPNKPDTDNDGILDGVEDTDSDGLNNVTEVRLALNPTRSDTDGDGINDRLDDEDGDGLLPLDELTRGTNPNSADSDFDGLDDGSEIAQQTDPLAPTAFTHLFYSTSVAFANGSDDVDPSAPVPVTFLSTPAAYLNGVEGGTGGAVPVLLTSAPVTYRNESQSFEVQFATLLSAPVGYANESDSGASTQAATFLSLPVSYFNERP